MLILGVVLALAANQTAAVAPTGTTVLDLSINEAGQVDGCQIIQSSGLADLDKQACQLMIAQGKYQPATDLVGKPVRSTDRLSLAWTTKN
ncbi:TonB family protein [Sphingomonas sp.]|uniref:TonB family protein n=1 Tax=Sphingomonas sp. TaxID=28214 RepID=UPI001E194960|nr:TonB family protein [Sphingomonas sp.]MBX9795831.1 energy transducer TonB [Sphingomonas sp.]